MAVRIRLSRVGATKRPAYRVVAIEGRKPRDGRSLEILGFYDPLTDPATVKIEADRVRAWIGKGAQPSDTVVRLLRQVGLDAKGQVSEAPLPSKPRTRKAPPKAARAAAARSKAATKESATAVAEPVEADASAEAAPESAAAAEEAAPEAAASAAPDAEANEAPEATPETGTNGEASA